MTQEKLDILRKEILQKVSEFGKIKYQNPTFNPEETIIPPSGKVLDGHELQNMVDASLDGWLTTGRFNEAFEKKLANYLGVRYLLTTNSGSSANLLAFSALTSDKLGERAIKPGDEVIGVAAGFPTTVNPILQFGAVPVFVDIEMSTHNIDVTKIEAAITPKTKAVMLAHSLGNPFNIKAPFSRNTSKEKRYLHWVIVECKDAQTPDKEFLYIAKTLSSTPSIFQ